METTANNGQLAVIDQKKDLVHLNELVTEINDLKLGYKDLKIEGPEDKAGYELVRAAIGVLRPKRTGLETERKSVVKPYNDTVKFINGEYEKITDLITDGPGGETELKEKKESIDNIVAKQKEEEDRIAEQKINTRINELIAAGMVFDGNWYSIGEMTLGIADIRTMSDNQFANTLQMVDDKSQKIAAEKKRLEDIAAKEKTDKEAADKAEREKFERKKKEFDDQQEAFKKQQDYMKAQQDKLDADRREAEMKEKQAEQNRINDLIKNRSAVLVGLGMKYNQQGDTYSFEEVEVSTHWITTATEGAWIESVQDTTNKIATKKEVAAKFLEAQQAKEKKDKAFADALVEKERLAGLSDKQRMQEYIDALYNVPTPPMTTKTWKAKVGTVRDFISDNRPA